ncbi:MAG: preprotein translocase subunit SecE [Pseudomonadales bacterium]|nr:preprotein translocase subunit SecE [Pseudomonadales bacterium]
MVSKAESQDSPLDAVKWLLVIGIILGGVYANSEYATVALLYRALAGVGLGVVAVVIALQTAKGRAAWELAKEARVEVRKVVWPTRQETTQTTLIVVAVVIFVALILWLLDSGLSWAVKYVIG